MQEKRALFVDNSDRASAYRPIAHWRPVLPEDCLFVNATETDLTTLDPQAYSHVVLSGAEDCCLDETAWMLREETFIRTLVGENVPLLGNCFGHQIMAKALFGQAFVRRSPTPEYGWRTIRVTADDPLFGRAGETQSGFLSHGDEVLPPPHDRAVVVAASDDCAVQAFKVHDRLAWGVQAHFEIGITQGVETLHLFGRTVDGVQRGIPLLDTGFIVPLMQRFLESR